jgi:hypothetical protein
MLAAASGILFGVCNVGVKALTGTVGDSGLIGLVSPWALVAVAGSATAFYASAKSLQDGEAGLGHRHHRHRREHLRHRRRHHRLRRSDAQRRAGHHAAGHRVHHGHHRQRADARPGPRRRVRPRAGRRAA